MANSESGSQEKDPRASLSAVIPYLWSASQVGWQVLAFLIIGLLIDQWAGTLPWATVILSMIGLVSAVTLLIRMGMRTLNKKSPRSSGK